MSALRRLVPALVAGGVMLFTAAGCQWHDGTCYVDKVFTSYTERLGVDYRTTTNSSGATVTLKMDVYSPPATDRASNRPAVIWGFGGA